MEVWQKKERDSARIRNSQRYSAVNQRRYGFPMNMIYAEGGFSRSFCVFFTRVGFINQPSCINVCLVLLVKSNIWLLETRGHQNHAVFNLLFDGSVTNFGCFWNHKFCETHTQIPLKFPGANVRRHVRTYIRVSPNTILSERLSVILHVILHVRLHLWLILQDISCDHCKLLQPYKRLRVCFFCWQCQCLYVPSDLSTIFSG